MKLIYQNKKIMNSIDIGENTFKFSVNVGGNIVKKEINIEELIFDFFYLIGDLENKIGTEIFLQIEVHSEYYFYVKNIDNKLIYFLERKSFYFKKSDNDKAEIHNENKELYILQTGTSTFNLVRRDEDGSIGTILLIDEMLSSRNQNEWYDIEISTDRNENMQTISTIKNLNKTLYITYYPKRNKINISKINLNTENLNEGISIESINKNRLKITNKKNQQFSFNFRESLKNEIKINGTKNKFPKKTLVSFVINKNKIFLYEKKGDLFASNNIKIAYSLKTNLKSIISFRYLYIFGRYTNNHNKIMNKYDYIYIKNSTKSIGKFYRMFKNKGRSFVLAKIKLDEIDESSEMHRGLYLGDEENIFYPLFMKEKTEEFEVFSKRKRQQNIIMVRANIGNGTSISILPYTKEYSKTSNLKMKIAKYMNEIIPKSKKYNLYFEKKSKKADESAIHVFGKVIENNFENSENFFILDKKASNFNELKQKYKNKLVKKNSYKHYFMIYRADYFIASELSNHVLNDRVFINDIKKKIIETPLIFLQHGIMFAKPIDNPMAKGFNKKNLGCNVKKTVISSEKEAEEFYKVNYEPEDLLLTGLATFDYATLNKDADKIAYMPTYRYWEEHDIYNNKMKETTYYKSIMSVIKIFEKNDLLDKLIIVPHNKFSEYILDESPEYKNIIHSNPSEALKVAKIFITDYSSAIYDAIYRGAYPIFYWEEKENLIVNYKAIPPVNEKNAPGPVVYTLLDLIETVKNAITRDYILEEEYKAKYKKINKFDDNKNTTRIVNYLIKNNIV